MSAKGMSGYEVDIRRNNTQIKVYDAPDPRDHELIIAHLHCPLPASETDPVLTLKHAAGA